MKNQVMTIDQAVAWREELAKQEKTLVFTNGCFDILHRGHAEYLAGARAKGDALIVAVNSDNSVRTLKGPSRPLNAESDRAYILACLEFVDATVIFDTPTCEAIIRAVKPDIYVKGGDYDLDSMNPMEKRALLDAGCEIVFVPFVGDYSTTAIIAKTS